MSPPVSRRASIAPISPAQGPESWNPAPILARLLEGDDPEIRLSAALEQHPQLSEALQSLPNEQVRRIQVACGEQYESLVALAQERNPDRFYETLVDIGARLEAQDLFEMAGRIYMTVVALNHNVPLNPSRQASVSRAQHRLELFSGNGSWGDRFEFWGRRVLRDSVDPTLLAGVGAATWAFRSVRLAVLTRLFRPVSEAPLMGAAALTEEARAAVMFRSTAFYRSRAALLAGAVGVGAEVTTYMMAIQLSDSLRGLPPDDWGEESVRTEFRSAYLMFAGMHFFGGAASLLARRSLGIRHLASEAEAVALEGSTVRSLEETPRLYRLAHEGATQAGMFSGLILAHRAAEHLGIVAAHGHPSDFLGDSLRFLMQVNLMRGLTYPFFRQQNRMMERSLSGAAVQ